MTRSILGLVLTLIFISTPVYASTLTESDITPGDLIRGESYSAVYYFGEDGLRYVFPNDKTYFTWYNDFDDVKWIDDTELANIQIGGNVTYKPGSRLVKITSDPTVYAIENEAILRPIVSESVATDLYGSAWTSQVDDIPDGFFGNYTIGSAIEFATQYDPNASTADAYNISIEKGLSAYKLVTITDSGYSEPTITISSGSVVRWLNTDTQNRSATEWERTWGSGTLAPQDHFSKKFIEKGTWHYYSMYGDRNYFEGAIIVQ